MMEGQKVDTATGVDGWDVMRCGAAEGGAPQAAERGRGLIVSVR